MKDIQLISINLIHLCIIFFVTLSPFTNNPMLLSFHVIFLISMMIHWKLNSDECCLTLLESKLRKIKISEGLLHRILSPFFTNNIEYSYVIWSITLGFLCISIIKLYYIKISSVL